MLLSEILKKKSNLKSSETKITLSSGEIYKEYTSASGDKVQIKVEDGSPGYVIDHKPDKNVAKVLNWLFMGSQDVANDEDLLKENGITYVLSLGVLPIQYEQINYKFLPIYDEPSYDISKHFAECFSFIEHCRTNMSIVYVHCNAGVSRSATLVIAYLMKYLGINLTSALERLKQDRPCVKPNDGFMKQLTMFEKELFAI